MNHYRQMGITDPDQMAEHYNSLPETEEEAQKNRNIEETRLEGQRFNEAVNEAERKRIETERKRIEY
jgi:hypothetical protein